MKTGWGFSDSKGRKLALAFFLFTSLSLAAAFAGNGFHDRFMVAATPSNPDEAMNADQPDEPIPLPTSIPGMDGTGYASGPYLPPPPDKEMGKVEKLFWITIKSVAPTVGGTIGASVGTTAFPAAVTAVVGALGISTAGTGFVAAVLIPASPVIGNVLGSGIGAGLFSAVSNGAYEIRMQAFRGKPKTAKELLKSVFASALADGVLAAGTSGMGAWAGKAVELPMKEVVLKILKEAGMRFAGNVILEGIADAAMKNAYAGLAEPMGEPIVPQPVPMASSSEIPAGNGNSEDELSDGPDPFAVAGNSEPNGETHSGGGGESSESVGFSSEVEQAAYFGVIAGILCQTSGAVPRCFLMGHLAKSAIAIQFWKRTPGVAHPAAH